LRHFINFFLTSKSIILYLNFWFGNVAFQTSFQRLILFFCLKSPNWAELSWAERCGANSDYVSPLETFSEVLRSDLVVRLSSKFKYFWLGRRFLWFFCSPNFPHPAFFTCVATKANLTATSKPDCGSHPCLAGLMRLQGNHFWTLRSSITTL